MIERNISCHSGECIVVQNLIIAPTYPYEYPTAVDKKLLLWSCDPMVQKILDFVFREGYLEGIPAVFVNGKP